MSPGKIAAQSGHAYCDVVEQARAMCPDLLEEWRGPNHGIKVALVTRNLHQLLVLESRARELGVPRSLVHDLGYTQFEGRETITCLGVGPLRRTDPIYRHLKRFQLMA
jgi:peptidyl-tRNA hydrolase